MKTTNIQDRLYELEELLEVAERKSDILTNLLKEANAEFERALQLVTKKECNFRAVFENAPEAIYIVDARTLRILDFNPFVLDWLGYTREDLLSMRLYDLVVGDPRDIEENVQKALDEGIVKILQRKYRSKNGNVIDAEVTGTLVEYEGKNCLAILVRDVTERKKFESISRYKELFENVGDPVFINDFDGNFLEVNEGACCLLEKSREQLLSLRLKELVNHDQLQILNDNSRRIREGENVQFELELTDRRGDLVTFELHSRPILFKEIPAILSVARDISVRKRLQETLIRTERLTAIGEMASGVAHNFNNLLQMIMMSAQTALMELDSGRVGNCQKSVNAILNSAERGADIVRRIRDFTDHRSGGSIESRKFDLSEIVSEAVEFTKPLWKALPILKKFKLNLENTPRCFVQGRPTEIYEVVVNLIKNAIEAMPDGGSLDIRTWRDKSHVHLTVSDTGHGIPRDISQKIFDPFFTTKGWKSSGLGLSSSYGLIMKHKGEIIAESDVGKGTTFRIVLPRAASIRKNEQTKRLSASRAPKIRLLVIDDEINLLTAMRMLFQQSEIDVVTAVSGREGFEAFRGGNIDVIMCDLGMDDMDGWEVAERIKSYSESSGIPKPPFIIYTGWDQNLDQQYLASKGVEMVVTKPLPYNQLLHVIQKVYKKGRCRKTM